MADGELSRLDAAILIGGWILGTVVIARDMPKEAQPCWASKMMAGFVWDLLL
jgi:hypothetical protein